MDVTVSRSSATRARILAAAREQFAAEGYDRATIRNVAAAAGADPALVMRYFGGKDGLFAASSRFDLRLPALDQVDRTKVGAVMVRHFLSRWEGDPSDRSLQILLRAGVTHAAAADRIRAVFAEQVRPALALVAVDQPELRAGLICSQILGLALCRYVLGIPPLNDMAPDAVVAHVAPTLQRYLTARLDGDFTG